MTTDTGGSLLIQTLMAAGADAAFGIHGAHIDAIFQAAMDRKFPIIDTRNEMSAGHAAEGYARVTGKFGVALVTAGGGFTNIVTSLANAWLDRTPLIVIAGSGALRDDETNTLQAGIDQVAIARPVTKWAHRVVASDHIPRLLAQAIRIATTAPRGPVLLDIPWDILVGEVKDPADMGEVGAVKEAGANDEDLSAALEVLLNAERPIVIAGGEVQRGGGALGLARFCRATGIPVLSDFEGLSALNHVPDDYNCGLVQGLFGLGNNKPDAVLMAGIRFGLNTAHGSGILIPRDAKIIQLDGDPREFGRLQPIELGVNGGVSASLDMLASKAEAIDANSDRFGEWRQKLLSFVHLRLDRVARDCGASSKNRLHPFVASKIVTEFAAKDNVIVADGALSYLWLSETVAAGRPRCLLCHGFLGSMGVGFGVALGAQLAAQKDGRRAILVTGDGAIGYALGEFDTAVRNDLPLIVVVMNNQSWGATQHFQKLVVGPNRVTKTLLPNGRYHDVASALNCAGYLATDERSLREALERALRDNRPACINVQVDLDPIPPEERILMGGMPFDRDFSEEAAQ